MNLAPRKQLFVDTATKMYGVGIYKQLFSR